MIGKAGEQTSSSSCGNFRGGGSVQGLMTRFSFALVGLAVLGSGCLGGSSAVSQNAAPGAKSGTLSGLVVIDGAGGQEATVADNGGIAHLYPVKAAPLVITGRTAAGKRLVRHSTTNKRGQFHLSLPAGRYTVAAQIFRSAPVQPHKIVVIEIGHAVRIRITGHVL